MSVCLLLTSPFYKRLTLVSPAKLLSALHPSFFSRLPPFTSFSTLSTPSSYHVFPHAHFEWFAMLRVAGIYFPLFSPASRVHVINARRTGRKTSGLPDIHIRPGPCKKENSASPSPALFSFYASRYFFSSGLASAIHHKDC